MLDFIIYLKSHASHILLTAILLLFCEKAMAEDDFKLFAIENSSKHLIDDDDLVAVDTYVMLPDDMQTSEEKLHFENEEALKGDQANTVKQNWLEFKDLFNSKLTLGYEYAYQFGDPKRIVMNRSSARLEMGRLFANRYYAKFDGKLTALGADDNLASSDNSFKVESKLREAYLEASFDNLTLKAGKQILIWGESDTAIVTDLISPRDLSELNFMGLEDSRVSQVMLVLDTYGEIGALNAFVNPDPGINEMPDPGTEYFVETSLPDVGELFDDKPGIEDTEYGLRWKRTYGQSDVAIMAADLVENEPVLVFKGFTETGTNKLAKEYDRFKMIGFAGNLAQGNCIWKAEISFSKGRAYQCEDQYTGLAATKKDTFDGAIGVEYSSSSRLWNLTFEAANKHILQYDDTLINNRRNDFAVTGIISRDFFNETLNIEYTILARFPGGDTFQKLRTEYDLTDNITGIVAFGGYTSQDEDGPFWEFRNKQRILISLKLGF